MHSYTVPLAQWSTRLLPIMRDPGSIPRGVLMWNRDSPVSVVLLHWWPRRDWSLWPHLRQALSRTVTRTSYRQCDNPTWSHTALLSRFHARCRSSFRLHNRHSWLLGGSPVESLQSHCIHTQSHWSSRSTLCSGQLIVAEGALGVQLTLLLRLPSVSHLPLNRYPPPLESLQSPWSSGSPVCFPSWGTRVQSPGVYLCETGILLLASLATVPYFFCPCVWPSEHGLQ